MIKKLSDILYTFLISVLILGLLFIIIQNDINISTNIIPLVFLVFFPFIDIIIETIKKNFTISPLSPFYKKNFYKYLLLIGIIFFLYLYGINLINIAVFTFLFFSAFFSLDPRISFLIALMLLIFTPIYLLVGDKELAESLSIYAYYFLTIGVILEIKSIIFKNNFPEKRHTVTHQNLEKSLLDRSLILLEEYYQESKEKAKQIKTKVLKDIGEDPEKYFASDKKLAKQEKIPFFQKAENLKKLASEKSNHLGENLYIKLFKYFVSKIKENIDSITLLLFISNCILAVFFLGYEIQTLIIYGISIFLLCYVYSKILGCTYCFRIKTHHKINTPKKLKFLSKNISIGDAILNKEKISQEEIDNISLARNISEQKDYPKRNNFFINKAILFGSFGIVAGHFLLQSFNIGDISNSIYFGIFALFFLSYYLVFSDLDSTIIITGKNTSQYIGSFSVKTFIKRHIYLVLNTLLIGIILITLGIKGGIFADIYQWNQERSGYKNWTLVQKKIADLTAEEKLEKAKEIRNNMKLISNEAEIEENTTSTLTGSNIDPKKRAQNNTQLINVRDYHTFGQSLSIGSKTDEVEKLEFIMKKLEYFNDEPDRIFDENTKSSLTNLLKAECAWPESTKGILGNQALQCLYSLEIEIENTP